MKKISYFVIYFIYSLIVVVTIGLDSTLALVISPVFPLILLLYFFKGFTSFYDYRFIYLLSLFTWGAGKSLSLLMLSDIAIEIRIVFIYSFLMFTSPLLALFFKFNINTIISKKQFEEKMYALTFFWIFSCFILFYTKYFYYETVMNFIAENIFRGLPIYFGVVLLLKIKSNDLISFLKSLTIVFFTVIPYTVNSFNRTAILFPFSILISSIFLVKITNNLNFKITRLKLFFYIIFISFVFLLSDLIKKTNSSILESLDLIFSDSDSLNILIRESNYIPYDDAAINYFNTLDKISEHENGIILLQLISSVMPRIFFPNKPETDISKILFSNDISPQPLYFEIFLEPYYDGGILGVYFYFFLYILLSSYLLTFVKKNIDYSLFAYAKSLYLISLVALFYAIRGPVIIVLQFLSIPIAIFFIQYLFFRRKI